MACDIFGNRPWQPRCLGDMFPSHGKVPRLRWNCVVGVSEEDPREIHEV